MLGALLIARCPFVLPVVPLFSFFLGCSRHVWVSFSLVYMVTTIARARKSLCAEKTAVRADTMDESAGGGCTHARMHTRAGTSIFFPRRALVRRAAV